MYFLKILSYYYSVSCVKFPLFFVSPTSVFFCIFTVYSCTFGRVEVVGSSFMFDLWGPRGWRTTGSSGRYGFRLTSSTTLLTPRDPTNRRRPSPPFTMSVKPFDRQKRILLYEGRILGHYSKGP